ncbi:MAG: TRAP transporter substrate-binding protein DctP [Candidatus Lambdaproteobacteria bacterium]|nr:TRAP transporter substrate-binding protein DctP [Candidatus Lambdaproteobacteria bacterium]
MLGLTWAGSAQAKTKWDFYSFLPIAHPVAQLHDAFTKEVAKRTNGELEITFRPAGELPFSVSEGLRSIGTGQAHIGHSAGGFMAGTAPLTSVGGLPFLVRNWDELRKVGPIIEDAAGKDIARHGAMLLYYYSWPPYVFWGSGKPIEGFGEFGGRKIRTNDADQTEMLRRLGAAGVTVATAEVPVAMERGVAQGLITSAYNANASRWYEFLKWGYLVDINLAGPDYVIVNRAAFDKLPQSQQQVLRDVSREWQQKFMSMMTSSDETARTALSTQHKLKLVQATDQDVQRFIALMQPYWEEWGKRNGPAGEDLVRRIRSALGK